MATNKPAANTAAAQHELSTNNFIIVASLVTLIAVILSIVGLKNLIPQLLLNNRVIAKKSLAANQLATNLQNIPTLKQNYAALGGNANLISDSLPAKPDFPAIVSAMDVMASSSGIKLKSVSPSATATLANPGAPAGAAATTPQPVSFSITLEGSYDAVLKFLTNIELSSRMTKVVSVNQAGPSTGQTYQASLTTFYQPPADLSLKMETVK